MTIYGAEGKVNTTTPTTTTTTTTPTTNNDNLWRGRKSQYNNATTTTTTNNDDNDNNNNKVYCPCISTVLPCVTWDPALPPLQTTAIVTTAIKPTTPTVIRAMP
jgi:hypothetical protein